MGYIFDFNTAKNYEAWCDQPGCRMSFDRETRLMLQLLNPMRGRRILDIGCGHGNGLKVLIEAGLEVTGLDPSPYMLDIARIRLGHQTELHRGVAEDLPFEDNAFHYACIVKALEFVEIPEKTLEEAFRVTRERVFIGLVNKRALIGEKSLAKGQEAPFCTNAHFLGLRKLRKIIRNLVGDVPVEIRSLWRPTTAPRKITDKLMLVPMVQKMPISMFTGIAVTLTPQWKTRPMSLRIPAKHGPKAIIG
jgi:ubiquinone/menaquinone biosynthesis C-methylase UbiE